jgi:dienelactone hydrolase
MKTVRLALFVAMAILLAARALPSTQGVVFQTTVAALSDEDIASPCRYELTIFNRSRPIRAVWVIFDRGRDMLRYYGDSYVQAFAEQHDLALLLPFQCRAKSYEDMNVDPANGLGRALFAALAQFAESSHHPELASARLILLGFSGAGSLVARLTDYRPDRVIAAIPVDPGHFDPLGMDTVNLSREAMAAPQLILAGGADTVSGTRRPYEYFRRHFDQGAPWTFVVQNNTPHCCIINAKNLMLDWLAAILEQGQRSTASPQRIDQRTGWLAFMTTRETDTKDSWGGNTSSVTAATIERFGARAPRGITTPAGWLPTQRVAKEWLSFVKQAEHPVTSLP